MSLTYERRECGNGMSLTEIYDKKFKTFSISIKMLVPRNAEKEALYSLALGIISSSNRNYPEREQLARALTGLYSSSLDIGHGRLGEVYYFSLFTSCLCDEYTIGKERISDKVADLLLDCLLDPYLENDAFSEKLFELCRADQLDDIESGINNKRIYAKALAERKIYEGESQSINPYDYKEPILAATPRSVTEAYRELLRTAYFDIAIYGGRCDDSIKQRVIERLSSIEREPVYPGSFIAPSPIKSEPARVEHRAEANQCQLIMAYKSPDPEEYAVKLFMCMLGGSPVSKLFANVREKLSLCYYCTSGIQDLKNTIIISSGLAEENLELAEKAIEDQLEALRNGDFTDDEINAAKFALRDSYLSNYDSKGSVYSWYFFQYMKGTNDSPEEKAEKIMALTREDIIAEAKKFKLDTVFTLKAENGGDVNEV